MDFGERTLKEFVFFALTELVTKIKLVVKTSSVSMI